jgi:O-antigen ligase
MNSTITIIIVWLLYLISFEPNVALAMTPFIGAGLAWVNRKDKITMIDLIVCTLIVLSYLLFRKQISELWFYYLAVIAVFRLILLGIRSLIINSDPLKNDSMQRIIKIGMGLVIGWQGLTRGLSFNAQVTLSLVVVMIIADVLLGWYQSKPKKLMEAQ